MRAALILLAVSGACLAWAQTPDIAFYTDLRPTLLYGNGGVGTTRWYDPMGRHSVVGLRMLLEPGLRVQASQRLQRIPNDPDDDLLDELYVENRGEWRLGKQYLPFGDGVMLNECAPAMRLDTQLVFDDAPIKVAVADGGSGRVRGVSARVGRRLGLSVAYGNHFGASGSSLTPIRDPDEALGRNRGYRLALGMDVDLPLGKGVFEAEWLELREAETREDRPKDVSELRWSTTSFRPLETFTVAWSRDWSESRDFLRFEGEWRIDQKVVLAPFVRFDGATWHDLAITARIRI